MKLEFSPQIFKKNTQVSNFMKIRPVGVELLNGNWRTDGRTDRHDKANSRFSLILRRRLKNSTFFKRTVFTYCVGSSEQKAVYPYTLLTDFSFIPKTECVYSAVRAERINVFQVNLSI